MTGSTSFSLSDHPYLGERLDAYASIGFVLGRTQHIAGFANVTNLPTRPAPMLARTVTSLSALSGGRIVLGMGAGGLWDRIADMGVPRLSPGDAVDAFEEAIVLVKMLSGGGPPVTYQGRYYQVDRDRAGACARASGVDRFGRPEVPGRHRPGGRRLDPRPRGGLAQRAVPGRRGRSSTKRRRQSAAIRARSARCSTSPDASPTVRCLPPRDRDGRWIGGSVGQWVEELTGAVVEHGASGFILFSPSGGTQDAHTLSRGPRRSPRPYAKRSRRSRPALASAPRGRGAGRVRS